MSKGHHNEVIMVQKAQEKLKSRVFEVMKDELHQHIAMFFLKNKIQSNFKVHDDKTLGTYHSDINPDDDPDNNLDNDKSIMTSIPTSVILTATSPLILFQHSSKIFWECNIFRRVKRGMGMFIWSI